MQFDFGMTAPKALANFQPGVGACDNPGTPIRNESKTLKAFANSRTLSGLITIDVLSQGCRKLQPWAEISQRLRR